MSTSTEFKVGDYVKIAPHTDLFMQGFAYGTVIRAGRKWVTVAWNYNPRIKRKFAPHLLERVYTQRFG